MILDEEERSFKKLIAFIFTQQGVDLSEYKSSYVKRRLAIRLRASGMPTYREYMDFLRDHPGEYPLLLDRLTINVTHFFRDPEVYKRMATLLFPQWRSWPKIRIWSAGCATGEEPYTLAILAAEAGIASRTEILATDIDPLCLAKARQGVYKEAALKEVPENIREKYFMRDQGTWRIGEHLKKNLTFREIDLTATPPPGPFDLIVCRNVMIYFMRNLQNRLLLNFHSLLSREGFLVLGKTETLFAEVRDYFKIIDPGERIYQRQELAPNRPIFGMNIKEV